MKQSPIALILSSLFFIGLVLFGIWFNATKPRVMILQSYDAQYAWTRDIDTGIDHIADDWTNYSLSHHYMNAKRLNDEQALRYVGQVARRAIDRFDPDVLIAVDDPAQSLAARFYVDHPQINIVFAGVNGSVAPYGYQGADNVTGIFERKPLRAVKELVTTLERDSEDPQRGARMYYLMDPSESMARDRKRVERFDWAPLEFVGVFVAEDYPSWQAYIRSLEDRAGDYLMVANYRKLRRSPEDPTLVPPAEVMHWTEAVSPIPVIGLNVFNVEDGAAIAVGASPFEQGEVAATLAATLLQSHQRGGTLAWVNPQHYIVAINEASLQQRRLELPQIYETFARATFTYIESDPGVTGQKPERSLVGQDASPVNPQREFVTHAESEP
ncbi:ABC transporter substrate-binding protein [Rhabdochromatium marinum]|uniref:ABC transporter substrate-binding protein n=1 Tax=Rhabdochromatium marinum TaxID=48729 RepID=UPI001905FDFF|nr:hypothetical protein [Rhabdochromatium marinum]MBK1649695.1 hypothetical protein [Rhabdochromatium marinum]